MKHYGTSEIEVEFTALEHLQNVMGVINTPIGRRKLGIDVNNPPEWFSEAVKCSQSKKG